MSRDNRQRILDFFAAFYAMDIDRTMEFYADSVDYLSWLPVEIFTHFGHRRTKAETRQSIATIFSRYRSMHYELLSIVAEDNCVATLVHVNFEKIHRDRTVKLDIANFYTLKDGLIIRQREFFDSYDLVQQSLEVDIGAILAENRK